MMFNITESVLSDKRILNASAAQEKEIYTVGTKTPLSTLSCKSQNVILTDKQA
jgi:hypothetical protein